MLSRRTHPEVTNNTIPCDVVGIERDCKVSTATGTAASGSEEVKKSKLLSGWIRFSFHTWTGGIYFIFVGSSMFLRSR